jgi:hypothetical protein
MHRLIPGMIHVVTRLARPGRLAYNIVHSPQRSFSYTPLSMSQKSLFGPTVSEVPAGGSFSSTGWNVTVPRGAEIVKPAAQLLEQLLPVIQRPAAVVPAASTGNALMDALKKTQNQARTQNDAEAYKSTESGKHIV